jgi:hypothetical protein
MIVMLQLLLMESTSVTFGMIMNMDSHQVIRLAKYIAKVRRFTYYLQLGLGYGFLVISFSFSSSSNCK